MIAGDVIKARLGAAAGVTGYGTPPIGTPPNDRIYKFWTPETPTYPAIVYKLLATDRLRGTYGDPGYCKATIQVICLAKTADDANGLHEQVRLALERFGSSQPAGIPFAGATLYDIEMGSSAEGFAFEAEAFYVSTDYTVHHLETTP